MPAYLNSFKNSNEGNKAGIQPLVATGNLIQKLI